MKKRIWIKILLAPVILVLLCAVFCVVSAIFSAHTFTVTHYELSVPLEQPSRLVQLSDLHNREYGQKNSRLIKGVRDLQPDLILMTGDMINSYDYDLNTILELTQAMSEIAPVYYCYGNHELSWIRNYGEDLRLSLEQAGATVLNVEYIDIDFLGNELRLGGYEGYYRAPHMSSGGDKEREKREIQFFEDFESTERYKILLDHIPTAWLDWNHQDDYDVDLVFCGHYHGGQIRLPLIGGLHAPYIGFFPPYTKGVFPSLPATVVLSAGLGSDHSLPRINNPGEIVCVDLFPEK